MNRRKKNIQLTIAIMLLCAFISSSSLLTAGAASVNSPVAENEDEEKYPNLYVESSDFNLDDGINDKTVYLTFDDGPSKNTEKILDILKKEGIKATFFVTMQFEDKEYIISLMKRMIEEGHTIGLHSENHDCTKIYKCSEAYIRDLDTINNFVIENTGYRPKIFRFPGGSKSSHGKRAVMAEIIDELAARGYKYYDWDVVSGDDRSYIVPAEQLARNVLGGIKPKGYSVVLFHDCPMPKSTPDAVSIVVSALKELGYKFDSLK